MVAKKYNKLEALNIRGAKLSKDILTHLFTSLVNLNRILIADCELHLPDELGSLFNKIECLALANFTNISLEELARLFQACENIVDLVIMHIPVFNLSCYPYPAKVKSLMLDAEQLEKEVDTLQTLFPICPDLPI